MKLFSQMRRFGNVLVLVLLSSCGGDDTGGGSDPGAGCTGGGCQTALTPVLSPTPSTFSTTTSVTLTDSTPGAVIHYTTDGSTPTGTSPTYSTPLSVATTTTIKAIAQAQGYLDSAVATGTYTISPVATTAATPTISPTPGTFSATTSVSLTDSTPGAVIHYTTDGSTPTGTSPTYSTPFSVAITSIIKAIAQAPGYLDSTVATGTYTITGGGGSCSTYSTIHLVGNQIHDTSGTQVVLRGPEAVVASTGDTDLIDQAASWGANGMRMLLTLDEANGMTPAGFDTLIGQAVSHNMIVWVSLYTWDGDHDHLISSALGGGNFYSLTAPDGTGTCSASTPAPCYLAVWSRQWLKDLIAKYQGHIIIDAMQEYIGTADRSTEAGRTEWANVAKVNIAWFRGAGYVEPLEIMSNFEGRDLYAIIEKGAEIRAADTLFVGSDPQTMFGWQAYWGVDAPDSWYYGWQGDLLLGSGNSITGMQAIHQFASQQDFPIQIGIDNYPGDTDHEYLDEMTQCATDNMSWLWWSSTGSSVECPADGDTCVNNVINSSVGFPGAVPSACGP
jgi:predicted secreted protein